MESIVLLVSFFSFNWALIPPTYLWPFGEDSFTYEVVRNNIGLSPALTDCFAVGEKHPALSYKPLYFDRNTTPYVDVRLGVDATTTDFSMTMFIYPKNLTGIILHYEADDQDMSSYDVRVMYMTMFNGELFGTIEHRNGASQNLQSGPYVLPSDQWTMIGIVNNQTAKSMSLYADVVVKAAVHGSNLSLKLPGTLRIGGGVPPYFPVGSILGYLTAVALYNTVNDVDNLAQLLNNAKKSNWPTVPSLPTCPDRVQDTVIVNHLWPLDERGLTLDTKTNSVDENSPCLRFGQIHSSLPNSAIHIDGSPLSYITLKINGSEIDETFTLTANVYIMSQSSGSFLKIIENQDQTLFEVAISETDIVFNAITSTNTNCASVTLSGVFTTNAWHVVGIHRDVGANTIGIMIDGNITDTSDTCGNFGLSGELFVQIGHSNRQLLGYRTDVRCLIMFSDPGSDIMTAIQDECTGADASLVDQVNNCTLETMRSRYHYLYKSDLAPPNSLSPLATYTSKHLTECAISCYGHLFCRSFTYLNNQCDVYDFVTESGLIAKPGAGYYVVDNRI